MRGSLSLLRTLLELKSDQAEQKLLTRIEELIKLNVELAELGKRWLTMFVEDKQADLDELRERVEAALERIEPKWMVVELQLELREAREEGDEDWIRDLENELRSLDGQPPLSTKRPQANTANWQDPVEITAADQAAVAELDFSRDVYPLLQTYCVDCHGRQTQAGDLDLQLAASELPLVRNSRLWSSVAEHVKNRVMPPADAEQPNDHQRKIVSAWLHNKIETFDFSKVKRAGYEPARRLTHAEYSNTVRDLFGIPLQVTDKFPTALSGTSGFANSANTLFVQPLLLERYMAAADEVVRQALPAGDLNGQLQRVNKRLFFVDLQSGDDEPQIAGRILGAFLSAPIAARHVRPRSQRLLHNSRRREMTGKNSRPR